jgi:hypothetical protein
MRCGPYVVGNPYLYRDRGIILGFRPLPSIRTT